jgi:hypothetical protein
MENEEPTTKAMSKPKNMTPEEEAAKKAYNKQYGMKHRRKNAEAERLRKMRWRHENPEKAKAMDARAKAKNPTRRLALRREKYNKNRQTILKQAEKYRLRNPNKRKNEIQQLAPSYISGLIGLPVSVLKMRPDLIELKRNQIKTSRLLKTITNQTNEKTDKRR